MSRPLDWLARRLGYVPKAELHRRLDRQNKQAAERSRRAHKAGYDQGYTAGFRTFNRDVASEVRRLAGEIEAERNGLRTQLKAANRRLRSHGLGTF